MARGFTGKGVAAMTDEIHKNMVRMRKIGEGLGYIRMAKYFDRLATEQIRQAERNMEKAKRYYAKADQMMGLGK